MMYICQLLVNLVHYAEELRKIFVGMLSKTCNDQDLKEMFQEFGPVEEVTVLRNHDATSKGGSGMQNCSCNKSLHFV